MTFACDASAKIVSPIFEIRRHYFPSIISGLTAISAEAPSGADPYSPVRVGTLSLAKKIVGVDKNQSTLCCIATICNMHECTSNELRAWCAGAIRRGADFEAVWTHILKYNSLVCGQPRQRAQASHPMVEVALATGERLMYDQSTREFWLGGPLQTSH